jgi:hypothetical protein
MPWMVPEDTFGGQNNLKSARAGRASRAGARAGRIIRIVRMIKLYKYFSASKEKERQRLRQRQLEESSSSKGKISDPSGDVESVSDPTVGLEDLPPESHVGAAMSDITTKRY